MAGTKTPSAPVVPAAPVAFNPWANAAAMQAAHWYNEQMRIKKANGEA